MKKKAYMIPAACTMVLTSALPVWAAEPGEAAASTDVTGALVSACTDMASSISGAIGQVLPIALPLVGISLVVTLGLKIFKKISGNA